MSLLTLPLVFNWSDLCAYLYIFKLASSSLLSSYYHWEGTNLYLSRFPIISLIFLATDYDMNYLRETLTQLFFGYYVAQYLMSPLVI